jgi:hypothetical protein
VEVAILVNFPWLQRKNLDGTFQRLNVDAGFVMNLDGYNVVALRVPTDVAKNLAGQPTRMGILMRLKSMIMRSKETKPEWLIMTHIQNPVLKDYNLFGGLVAERLTDASGTNVTAADLAISCSTPVTAIEPQTIPTVSLPNRS